MYLINHLKFLTPIARQLGIRLDIQSVEHVKNTKPQTDLPAKKRLKNVKNAFVLIKKILVKHVAILDDVITTGSTVNEIAELLIMNGVEQVEVWCCAKTEHKTC